MEIIKHGSQNQEQKPPRQFICPDCGCMFIAEANEYNDYGPKYLGVSAALQVVTTRCPECKGYVSGQIYYYEGVERWRNGRPIHS